MRGNSTPKHQNGAGISFFWYLFYGDHFVNENLMGDSITDTQSSLKKIIKTIQKKNKMKNAPKKKKKILTNPAHLLKVLKIMRFGYFATIASQEVDAKSA